MLENAVVKNQANAADKVQVKDMSKNTDRSGTEGKKQAEKRRRLENRDYRDNLTRTGSRVRFKYTG